MATVVIDPVICWLYSYKQDNHYQESNASASSLSGSDTITSRQLSPTDQKHPDISNFFIHNSESVIEETKKIIVAKYASIQNLTPKAATCKYASKVI